MAILRSSNPAFTRGAGFGAPTPGVDELERMHAGSDRLTVDDVVLHTLGLFAVLGIAAGFGWMLTGGGGSVALASGLGALALSFAIGFSRTVRPALIIVFAALEGLFVGGISRIYETAYAGIVAQALLGTGIVFITMLVAYRSGRLRATPRMRKIVIGTLMGVVGVGLLDLLLRATGVGHVPILNDASPLGILLSVGILVVAALQFILDFDFIESAVRAGAPKQEAWRASYGLLVGFVWVYLELLRLLGKLRQ
ncbi:MAG TPA: Bax inhibitor-1/YccA family protein [Nakamurella sp.]